MLLPDHFSTSKKNSLNFLEKSKMWADRVVWLCLVGFLTAELMAQAALSFNGSNYLQPPPFLVPTDSPHPSSLTVVYGISVFLFQWLLWSAWDSISSSSIFPFLGRGALCCPRNDQVSIKFYYTNQIDHSVLINILCVFFNQLPPPVDQRTNCVARGSVVPGPLLY